MKKFLFMFLLVAAVACAFSFVLAQSDEATGEKKFILHGEIRQRADYNDNLLDFSSDTSDSFLFFPYRARIAAEGHFGKNVTGMVEFQSFGFWGDVPPIKDDFFGPVGAGSPDAPTIPFFPTNIFAETNSGQNFSNDVELYQAYVAFNSIGGSKWSLKIGRQEIVRGTEMLLGDNDYYDGISHDGAMASLNAEHFNLDVFYTRPLQSPDAFFDGAPPPVAFDHQSVNFWGAYLDWNRYKSGIGWAAYALYYEDGLQAVDPSRRAFWTLGGRCDRDVTDKNGIFWNAELAYQTGEYNVGPGLGDTGDIQAMGWEGTIGYNLHGNHNQRFRIFYDLASGDDDGTDNKAKGFDPLFQDSHDRYGLSDRFVFSNLTVWGAGYSMTIGDRSSWGVDFFNQSMTEKDPATGEDQFSQELDGWWKMQYNTNTQIQAGLAYVMPGDEVDALVAPASSDNGIRLVSQVRLRW